MRPSAVPSVDIGVRVSRVLQKIAWRKNPMGLSNVFLDFNWIITFDNPPKLTALLCYFKKVSLDVKLKVITQQGLKSWINLHCLRSQKTLHSRASG